MDPTISAAVNSSFHAPVCDVQTNLLHVCIEITHLTLSWPLLPLVMMTT